MSELERFRLDLLRGDVAHEAEARGFRVLVGRGQVQLRHGTGARATFPGQGLEGALVQAHDFLTR